jgi:outer membrane lipoprotein carrier protein
MFDTRDQTRADTRFDSGAHGFGSFRGSFRGRGRNESRRCRGPAIWLFLTILLLFAAAPAAAQEEPEPLGTVGTERLLETISDSLETVRSIRADFIQERTLAMFLDTLVTEGRLYFEEPEKLRWEVLKPYHSIMLFVDGRIAKFDIKEGTPVPMRMGSEDIMEAVMQEIAYWMKGDFSKSRELYDLMAFETADRFELHLTPGNGGTASAGPMIIGIDPETYHVVSVTIDAASGNGVEIRFVDERVNLDFDPGLFDRHSPVVP